MKTTLDIHDELLARARRHARETGRPLRAVVEEGLRRVLARPVPRSRYKLPDLRAGDPAAPDPLERFSWHELRETIYDDPGGDRGGDPGGDPGARWSPSTPIFWSMRTAAKRARVASPSNRMIGETDDFPDILERFVNRPHVVGGGVHDARIAAICVAHAVEALFTRDRDFSLFPELLTHDPFEAGRPFRDH